jgi:hypothetical protein
MGASAAALGQMAFSLNNQTHLLLEMMGERSPAVATESWIRLSNVTPAT